MSFVPSPFHPLFPSQARRFVNEGFQPAAILEVILYDWSRGSGYSGSYAAPRGSGETSAESRAETADIGSAPLSAAGDEGAKQGTGEKPRAISPILSMDACPCDPALLFRDGDMYEDEDEDGDGEEGT